MSLYQWVLALHIISMIAWMAGMFYLPRLYVYHAGVEAGSQAAEIFKLMERRLLRIIINPAMIATLIFGGWLLAL
ncbi:MAG TPA: CopD family protein, partial [Alphaproteobacteria bacterium]|nr:CopD family protein [Alphaproteobacteria bacterium]